jgi:glycolate oxidase
MGTSPENLLAAEWVMPTGEILRTGSLGSDLGWFSGDGPGPSTRGIFKGVLGAAGGLGVFTKVAVKLYPWPGYGVMPIEGTVPVYTARLPETVRAHTLAWATWEDYAEAVYKIFYNDIGYIAHRQFIMFGDELQAAVLRILTDNTKTLSDLEDLLKKPEIKKLTEELRRSFQIVLAGMTPRDIKYQERVLDQVLAETGGWKVEAMEEPTMAGWSALYMIKLCFKALNYVYAGGFHDAMARGGTPDLVTSGWMEEMREQKRKFGKQGGIVDDGGDAGMGGVGSIGGGGYAGYENFTHYDPSNAESVEATHACREEAIHIAQESGIGDSNPFFIENERLQNILAERKSLSIYFQSKIKEAFDPNGVGDGSYLSLEK